MQTLDDSLNSLLLSLVIRLVILIWLVCGAVGVDGVVLLLLLYRLQSLLGDKTTLSPSPFPSLYVIALIVVGPEFDSHVLVPYTIIVDNFELHHEHERTELLDSLPSIVLDHCKMECVERNRN